MRLAASARVIGLFALAVIAAPLAAQSEQELFRQFEEAKAREVVAVEALGRANADASAAEQRALAAADAEVRAREIQIARIAPLDRAIADAADRVVFAGLPSSQTATERAVLEDWYAQYQRVAANLTERSFSALEVELAAFAQAGLVAPTAARRFRNLREVRSAIQVATRRMEQEAAARGSGTEVAKAELARLVEEREAIFRSLAAENPANAQAVTDWNQVAGRLGRETNAVFEAQQAVFQAYQRYSAALEGQRPPALVSVTARQEGAEFYRAGWLGESGATPDESARQQERARLIAERQKLIELWDTNTSERRDGHAARLDLAERMMSRSRALERSAARYARLKEQAVWVGIGVDVGLTVAELALTGGTATLARKATDYATQAGEKAAQRKVARELIAGATPVEKALLKELTSRGDTQADAVRAAARYAESELRKRSDAMVRELLDKGVPSSTAIAQVERQILEAVARFKDADRLTALATRGRAEQIAADAYLDSLGRRVAVGQTADLGVLGDELFEEALTKLAGNAQDYPKAANWWVLSRLPASDARLIAEADAESDTKIGEGIELGVTLVANTYSAAASEGAAGMAKLTQKIGRGLQRNAASLGIGIVSSAVEIGVARAMDNRVNAEGAQFARDFAELEFLYSYYRGQLDIDQDLRSVAALLARDVAAIDARLRALNGGYRRLPPQERAGKADGTLAIDLAFSGRLLAAPSVRVGSVVVPVAASGTDGLRWSGTASAAALGPGTHRVEVAADARATPFGSLDADITTVPRKTFGQRDWSGFEKGPDRSYSIKLDPVQPTLAAETCPARMPAGQPAITCSCPATSASGSVWGTFYYTDDSELCRAARHAGVVAEGGGSITARAEAGRDYYTGSAQNGISSQGYGKWGRTIVFASASSAESTLANFPLCPATYNASVLAATAGRCRCIGKEGGSIWGSGPYTSDTGICVAARHAGIIGAGGGIVRAELSPGLDSYAASTRNGVTSGSWGKWSNSLRVSPGN